MIFIFHNVNFPKQLTILLFIGLAFWGCKEKIKYEESVITVYESGSPNNVIIRKVHNGKKIPYKKRKYYRNGSVQIESEINEYGRNNGSFIEYNEIGTLKVSGYFTLVNGESKKDGQWVWWKDSGEVDKSETYRNGLLVEQSKRVKFR